jgi:hypothetical protein
MHLTRFLMTGVVLAAAAPPALRAQAEPARILTIAVVDGYPAFDPEVARRHPRARPLAALAVRRGPSGDGPPTILLNPLHADLHTLAAAVDALGACPAAGADAAGARDYVPIFPRAQGDPVARRDAPRLAAWLRELRAQPRAALEGMDRTTGQAIVVAAPQDCGGPGDRAAPPPAAGT